MDLHACKLVQIRQLQNKDLGLCLGLFSIINVLMRSPWDLSLYLLVLQYYFCLAKKKIRERPTRGFITKTIYSGSRQMLNLQQPPGMQISFDRRIRWLLPLEVKVYCGYGYSPQFGKIDRTVRSYLSEHRVDNHSTNSEN